MLTYFPHLHLFASMSCLSCPATMREKRRLQEVTIAAFFRARSLATSFVEQATSN
jgi:hypothetical protein